MVLTFIHPQSVIKALKPFKGKDDQQNPEAAEIDRAAQNAFRRRVCKSESRKSPSCPKPRGNHRRHGQDHVGEDSYFHSRAFIKPSSAKCIGEGVRNDQQPKIAVFACFGNKKKYQCQIS